MADISDPNVVQTEEMCIKAVKQNWSLLQYVNNQTEAICIEAINSYFGFALQYVKNQTESICIGAIKQNAYALKYVRHQTETMCMEAVKKCGSVLQIVEKQTEAICICAVKQCADALRYVKNQTDVICLEAIENYFSKSIARTVEEKYYGYSPPSYTFGEIYKTIVYPSPQLITELLKLYPSHTDTIMTTYATDIMKTYKAGSNAIVTNLVLHANDLLYRPNSINALVSHARWHKVSAKTVFLMA